MNKMLARQLRRWGGSEHAPPSDWERFLRAAGDAYDSADEDRVRLERIMDEVLAEPEARDAAPPGDPADRERVDFERSLKQKLG